MPGVVAHEFEGAAGEAAVEQSGAGFGEVVTAALAIRPSPTLAMTSRVCLAVSSAPTHSSRVREQQSGGCAK